MPELRTAQAGNSAAVPHASGAQ